MKIDILQDSKEWFDWRRGKYGASLAPYLLKSKSSQSFYKTYMDNTNNTGFKSYAMEMGVRLENDTRRWAEEYFNMKFSKYCYSYDDFPKIIASLDGINIENNIIVEIKTSKKDLEELLKIYMPQIQQQLFVYNNKNTRAYLVSLNPYTMKHEISKEIYPDAKMQDDIFSKWVDFDNYLNNNVIVDNFQDELKLIDHECLINEGLSIKSTINNLENRLNEINEVLLKSFGDGSFGDFNIISQNKNTWNYKKYIEDNKITISNDYLKESKSRFIKWNYKKS